MRIVGTDYFKTMGIPLRQGRVFDETDRFDSTPVVIVNERFAEQILSRTECHWQADHARLQLPTTAAEKMREIVGVVGNVKHLSLEKTITPEMYLPQTQIPFNIMSLVVRTSVSNPGAITARRSEGAGRTRSRRSRSPASGFSTNTSRARWPGRASTRCCFRSSPAPRCLLTAIGIYGVMAYSVSQRTNEIGIRIALGAARSSIFRLVVGQAMTLVAISLVVGLAGAFAATRLLNSLLFGVGASDPMTFVAIVLLVSAVAFVAAWLPARRAMRVDPVIALRAE